jgi:hypothetical protein
MAEIAQTDSVMESERLNVATDQAIAACGANMRSTIRALILANEFLESELESQVSHGYRKRNPRKNSLFVGLLLNSQIDEFSPDVVMHSLRRKMKPTDNGVRFPHIDAVIYISEKHFQRLPDGRIAFAIVIVGGVPAIEHPWKMGLMQQIAHQWSEFRTGAGPVSGCPEQFQSVDDIPDKIKCHEAWKLAYKRNPYLRMLTDQQLKLHFHRCIALASLGLLKGNWPEPSQGESAVEPAGSTMRSARSTVVGLICGSSTPGSH